ncbi:hypothetical protein C6Y55_19720 [Stenotrophomonas maltophilia]|nr:hypothetical protein C6Y55_19720 [Stenotrophomonas maltophilia]
MRGQFGLRAERVTKLLPAVSTKVDTYQQHSRQRVGWKAPLLFKGARRRRGDKVECAGSSAYAPSA